MSNKIVKFFDCNIPVSVCNMKCEYCYVGQCNYDRSLLPNFKYSAKHMARAFNRKRMGGTCLLNFCGQGETLLPKEMPDILRALLEEGHYVMVVTNGTLKERFNEIITFPKELRERIFFKISFHYKELKRQNMLDIYFENIKKIKASGCSFSIELGASDDYIPLINEIKEICMKNLGALPQVIDLRDDTDKNKKRVTKLSHKDFLNTWKDFNSGLFEYRENMIYAKKVKDFCYAGLWSGAINMATGDLRQCYRGNFLGNIFENIDEPVNFSPLGCACKEPYCYVGHTLLTIGIVPKLNTKTNYNDLRNRICTDGTEWITPVFKEVFAQKISENNKKYSFPEEFKVNLSNNALIRILTSTMEFDLKIIVLLKKIFG